MNTIIFDTETTGLLKPDAVDLSEQPRIIEFYGVKVNDDFEIQDEIELMINPGHPLPEIITKITGINDSDLKGKPSFTEVYLQLAEFFIGTKRMVAHNLAFDRDMIKNELTRMDMVHKFPWPIEHICTVEKSMHIKGFRLSLQRLHQELLQEGFKDAHRAKKDVFALVRCYHALVERGDI